MIGLKHGDVVNLLGSFLTPTLEVERRVYEVRRKEAFAYDSTQEGSHLLESVKKPSQPLENYMSSYNEIIQGRVEIPGTQEGGDSPVFAAVATKFGMLQSKPVV